MTEPTDCVRFYVADRCKVVPPRELILLAARNVYPGPPLEGPLSLHVKLWIPRPHTHMGTGRHAGNVSPAAPTFPSNCVSMPWVMTRVRSALRGILWKHDDQLAIQNAVKRYESNVHTTGMRIVLVRMGDLQCDE